MSSKRPLPDCSSSVTSAWKRRPFLSTSTMSPAPMPLDVVRGSGPAGAAGTSMRLSCMAGTLGRGADGLRHGGPHGAMDAHVLGAIRADLEEGDAVRGERAVERRAERLGVGDALVLAAVERGGVGEVKAVGRRDVA